MYIYIQRGYRIRKKRAEYFQSVFFFYHRDDLKMRVLTLRRYLAGEIFTRARDFRDETTGHVFFFPGDARSRRFFGLSLVSTQCAPVSKTRPAHSGGGEAALFPIWYWCATHSVCRRQVWAVATRVSHATYADPSPGVCPPRTPWWSCSKNTHTPPHFTTFYSITLILTLLL